MICGKENKCRKMWKAWESENWVQYARILKRASDQNVWLILWIFCPHLVLDTLDHSESNLCCTFTFFLLSLSQLQCIERVAKTVIICKQWNLDDSQSPLPCRSEPGQFNSSPPPPHSFTISLAATSSECTSSLLQIVEHPCSRGLLASSGGSICIYMPRLLWHGSPIIGFHWYIHT